MKKVISLTMICLIAVSTFAMLLHTVGSTDLQFQLEPLIVGPTDDWAPFILQDSTNKIWVFFISSYHLFYITSVDGGNNWSDPSLFLPAYVPGLKVLYTVAFQDSTDRIWVAWLNHTAEHNADQVWFSTSNDGENWTSGRQLCPGHNDMGGFIEAEGKVWFFFSPLSNGWRVSYRTTDDGGESWSSLVPITTSGGMRTPHATVLSNGTIFVVYRVGAYHYEANIGYSASSDGGLTWRSGIVVDPPYPEHDGSPRVTEYNDYIYVFFVRYYLQAGPWTDIWFSVWNKTKWENPQPLTEDEFTDGGPCPSRISNQLWVVWGNQSSFDICLARSKVPILTALIDIDPNTLNLKSNGKFVTACIELPEGYDVADIDLLTVQLEGIPAITDAQYGFVTDPASYLTDHDGDGVLERMVKFDRATVRETLTGIIDYEEGVKFYELTLTVTGELLDGTLFEGTDTITVIKK